MALVEIGITGNGGYSPDQVRKMSVGELISELENFDSDDKIYLHDEGNRYGAAYGYINYVCKSDEDDEDEYYESSLYSNIKKNLNETQKLNEHTDYYANSVDINSPTIKAWVDILKEKKPEATINSAYICLIEGGWEPSTVLFDTDKGVYKVVIPNANDGSVASYMGYKREPSVKYVDSNIDSAMKYEEIDYYS